MYKYEIEENLLDFVGYHEKWHGNVQKPFRKPYEFNQNDHLIEEIFRRMGIKNGFFVEFGAWDGIKGSNTRKLYQNGWRGILIEPESQRFLDLQKNYETIEHVTTLNRFVGIDENLFDDIVEDYVDDRIHFCSIDIDGVDLEVFETFEKFLPDVVCIEGGQMLNPMQQARLSLDVAKNNIQQSLYVMNKVFESKGYKLLCTYQDSFFIKEEYYELFNVKDDLVELYLDGILAYPRIPWIVNKLSSVGLENGLLEIVAKFVPFCSPTCSTKEKIQWVDDQYPNIIKVVEKIRSSHRKNKENNN